MDECSRARGRSKGWSINPRGSGWLYGEFAHARGFYSWSERCVFFASFAYPRSLFTTHLHYPPPLSTSTICVLSVYHIAAFVLPSLLGSTAITVLPRAAPALYRRPWLLFLIVHLPSQWRLPVFAFRRFFLTPLLLSRPSLVAPVLYLRVVLTGHTYLLSSCVFPGFSREPDRRCRPFHLQSTTFQLHPCDLRHLLSIPAQHHY